MKNKFCICTYVSGKEYQEFIPVYIYSILKSYPHYDVMIFCGESLEKNVKSTLDILSEKFDFKVIDNFLDFNSSNISKKVCSKLKRWLVYSEKFIDYDYIYIGDIDIFILNEKPGMLNQHIVHCNTIGLSYSNVIRRSGENRITGLHFIKTEPYFEKMLPIIRKYTQLLEGNSFEYEYESDEYFLYNMIQEANLGLCPRATGKDTGDPTQLTFRPDHGVHLAVFRDYFVKKRRIVSESFLKKMEKMKLMIDDPVFEMIEGNFESKMVKRIFQRVHKF